MEKKRVSVFVLNIKLNETSEKIKMLPINDNTSSTFSCRPLINGDLLTAEILCSDCSRTSSAALREQEDTCSSYALLEGGGRRQKRLKVFLKLSIVAFLGVAN